MLPKASIAFYPQATRGDSRLLVLNRADSRLYDERYANLVDYFNPGDLLILNDTKVIKARLQVQNKKKQLIEILLLEEHGKITPNVRRVLYRGELTTGEILLLGSTELEVIRVLEGGMADIRSVQDFNELALFYGEVPLPPYIKRPINSADTLRYQSIFAQKSGSVAAPTASLNMTTQLLSQIRTKGIRVEYLTLHVGLGTFLPIRTSNIAEHKMHSEYFEIPSTTVRAIQQTKTSNNQVIALGTTVARTLEYCGGIFSQVNL
ncbi:MAG: S-adenosylmethionine:tRNA ribosyltransferase-isomerase [Candidatus Saccharimonadia bacterium]